MNDDPEGVAVLMMFGAFVAGPLLGGVAGLLARLFGGARPEPGARPGPGGRPTGRGAPGRAAGLGTGVIPDRGIGWTVGFLATGLGVFVAAGYLYVYGVRPLSVMGQTAQGVLVGFETVQSRDAEGRGRATPAPRVRFVSADGRTVEFTGLGGNLARQPPGSAVPVRYRPDDPHGAIIDNFQERWAGVFGIGLFGTFPTLVGGAVVADWLQRRFPGRVRGGSRRTGANRALLVRGGHVLVLCAIAAGALVGDAGRAIGNVLVLLAMAMTAYLLACLVDSPRNWHRAYNLFCVAVMLALFGALTLLVAVRG